MKECPTCRRVFPDASLRFCRMDGTRLVNKTVQPDEALTVLFSTGKLQELRRRKDEPQKGPQ